MYYLIHISSYTLSHTYTEIMRATHTLIHKHTRMHTETETERFTDTPLFRILENAWWRAWRFSSDPWPGCENLLWALHWPDPFSNPRSPNTKRPGGWVGSQWQSNAAFVCVCGVISVVTHSDRGLAFWLGCLELFSTVPFSPRHWRWWSEQKNWPQRPWITTVLPHQI